MEIRKRKKGKGVVWCAVLPVGYEVVDGKRKRKERSQTFDTKTAAVAWLTEERRKLQRGEWVPPSQLTLSEFFDQWARGALALGSQRPRTKEQYRWLLDTYVRPVLGPVRLERLTRATVQDLAAKMLATEKRSERPKRDAEGRQVPPGLLSPVTVRRTLAALGVALEAAREQGLIHVNPARSIRLPRAEKAPARWLTQGEARSLIAGTAEDRHGPLWHLLLGSGLRPGEALGLPWEHVDLETGVIRVRQSLVPQKATADGRVWRLDEPKTAKSRRAVPVDAALVRALRAHRRRQAEERLAAGERYAEHGRGGFVFASPRGEPYRIDALGQTFARVLTRLELPAVSLYGLRHTHATLLLEAGVPMKVVTERLGHSSIVLTADTYSHVSAQLQEQAVERFAILFNPAAPAAQEREA